MKTMQKTKNLSKSKPHQSAGKPKAVSKNLQKVNKNLQKAIKLAERELLEWGKFYQEAKEKLLTLEKDRV